MIVFASYKSSARRTTLVCSALSGISMSYRRALTCVVFSLLSWGFIFSLFLPEGAFEDLIFLLMIFAILAFGFIFYGLIGALLWVIAFSMLARWRASPLSKHLVAVCASSILLVPYLWAISALLYRSENVFMSFEMYAIVFPVSMLSLFYYWLFFLRKECTPNKAERGDY